MTHREKVYLFLIKNSQFFIAHMVLSVIMKMADGKLVVIMILYGLSEQNNYSFFIEKSGVHTILIIFFILTINCNFQFLITMFHCNEDIIL